MAKNVIVVTTDKDINDVIADLTEKMHTEGGTWQTWGVDDGSMAGDFKVRGIVGTYTTKATETGTEITVTIASKPFIIPMGMITSEISRYFS